MKYSVIGVWVGIQPVVAGVVEGAHPCVDRQVDDEYKRWAALVDAADPDTAEALGVKKIEEGTMWSLP